MENQMLLTPAGTGRYSGYSILYSKINYS